MSQLINANSRLNDEQVEFYNREGYIIYPEAIFPEDKFQRLKAHFEQKLADLPAGARPEAMDVPHFTDLALFEWLFADEVLDLVEPILGPDLALFSSHFISKPKGDGRRVPWHEDSAYWRDMLNPMEVVTVWLAIDPSLEENGCMKIIPHTHNAGRKGFSDYEGVDQAKNVFSTEILRNQRDESKAVSCILQPNHASLHDGRLMHGSAANTSNMRRCGYTMRYISAKTVLSAKHREFHQIYLARGREMADQPYGNPKEIAQHLIDFRNQFNKKVH